MRVTILVGMAAIIAACAGGCSDNATGRIEASGTIEGTDVNVGSEVAGRVLNVLVREGDRVAPGDTLVIINPIDYELQYRQALANAEAGEAQYRLAVAGSRREDVLQAEAAYKAAEADYRRMKDLIESRTVTQKQYDDAHARYIAAQQTYEKLAHGLRKDEIVMARARRDQAVALADQAKKKLNDCFILSPSAGTVTLRGVEPGELTMIGSVVTRVTYLDRVKLTIYVGEQDLGHITIGQRAEVRIDSFKDRLFEGKVTYISPTAEFTPKNVQTKEERTKLVFGVRIEVDNPDGALKPGLPADALITVGSAD